jgi:DNA-binding response OmpR family regulator/HPt (histidine-containing phosphotransfer) domain-containing protein
VQESAVCYANSPSDEHGAGRVTLRVEMTSTSPDDNGGTSSDLTHALSALREHFRASSGPIVATFEQLATQLTRMPTFPRALEALRRELHRVKGTAGSYGFLDASALAARLEERVAAWIADPELELESRATIISHFGSALRLAFQAPIEADRLPALTGAPRRRMLLVDVSGRVQSALAEAAAARGYVLEVAEGKRLGALAGDRIPHVVVVPREYAAEVMQAQSQRWLPTLSIDDGTDGAASAASIFDRADRLLLATTWLRPTILLLDDDPSILEIARYALGQELRVVTIESPLQLFETLEREQPIALLFEARLPSFDAIAFTRLLRGMPAYRDLPVLLLAGNMDGATSLAAYDAGIDETLAKPLIPLELRARVASRLERLRVERLTKGLHAMTAIALPSRLGESLAQHRALTEAGRRATSVLISPRLQAGDSPETVAWLRESRRLVRALGATARFAAYRDDLALLLILDSPSALARRVLESLRLNKPGEAPEWDPAVEEANGPEGFLKATEE